MKRKPLLFGVGLNDLDCVTYRDFTGKKKNFTFYETWRGMLRRCYSLKSLKKRPTYNGCTVCKDWRTLSNFKTWFDKYYIEGYHLDKDLLDPLNKEYCPSKCLYIPPELNSLLTDRKAKRGKFKQGVSWCNATNKFKSELKICGRGTYLGVYTTEVQAFNAYYEAKISHVKGLLDKYVSQGILTKEQADKIILTTHYKLDLQK